VWLPADDNANGLAAGLNNLGTLGGSSSRADGPFGIGSPINNKGQVVGRSHTKGDRETHAFIWDRVNKMRNLNSTALTPNKATFSYLWIAHGISDTGYIMGRGITAKGNHTRSFLLTPVW
jgi:probable HAF family extracellular repeat protein